MRDRIDGVLVDTDESGFELILSGEKGEYRFDVQGVAEELLFAVKTVIEPWWLEGQHIRSQYERRDRSDEKLV